MDELIEIAALTIVAVAPVAWFILALFGII